MAIRPVFIAQESMPYVRIEQIEFRYYSGFALSQSRKSIESLHECFTASHPEYAGLVLEISSKSDIPLGVHLSAFNLMYTMSCGERCFVENVFQAGKCFENGGPYTEILGMSAAEAKRYQLLRTSGNIVKFQLEGKDFPTEPKAFFYDWVYVNALNQNKRMAEEIVAYRAFTDIAFNPSKSINCQARSVALFVALCETGLLGEAISSPEAFLKTAYGDTSAIAVPNVNHFEQLSLF